MTSKEEKTPANLAEANRVQEARDIDYFRSIPWCAALLLSSSTQGRSENSSSLSITQSDSRILRPNLEDALMSRTLNSPDAIPHYITFHSGVPSSSSSSSSPSESSSPQAQGSTHGYVTKVSTLVALGPMVNGWEGICHGGVVMTLIDEAMGQLFTVNKRAGKLRKEMVFTGYLNTRFKKPVRTGTEKGGPSVVLVVAELKRVEGRKYWTEAVVMGPRDGGAAGDGGKGLEELASAEAVFVQVRAKL